MNNLRKNFIYFVFTFIIFLPSQLFSNTELKKINLKEALNIAYEHNHDYLISIKKQKAANEKVNIVWGQLFPILESEASMARQHANKGFMSLSDGQYDLKVVQLKFGINPGIFYNSLKISRDAYKAAVEEVRKIRSEIEYNVIKSYFLVLISEEVINLRKEVVQLLKVNLKDVENLYKTGSVPKFELLQAQVKLKSQEPLLLEAENKHKVALDLFNYHLGLDNNKYTVDRDILDKGEYKIADSNIEDVIERLSEIALKNRPEIVQLKMKKEISIHLKNINSSYYLWPTFTVGGYYGFNKNLANSINSTIMTPSGPISPDLSKITGDRNWQSNWQIRVAATYRWGSFFSVDSKKAEEREQAIIAAQAEEEILKLKRLILISIKSSYSNLVTSYYSIHSHKENVITAKEGLRIARQSYKEGVIKNSELLAAQLAFTEAKTSYINSINDYYLSLAELQKEMGVDDENIIFGGK